MRIDGEGELLYGTALMTSEPAASKHKASAGDDSVSVLVDSGASGHYLDDLITPSVKHRLLNYVLLTTPRKILTAGGALLDGTAEGMLKGLSPTITGNSIMRGSSSSLCLA